MQSNLVLGCSRAERAGKRVVSRVGEGAAPVQDVQLERDRAMVSRSRRTFTPGTPGGALTGTLSMGAKEVCVPKVRDSGPSLPMQTIHFSSAHLTSSKTGELIQVVSGL